MFTILDINDVANIRVTEDGITVRQKSRPEEFLVITPEDELYEYHLKNVESLRKQLTDSWDQKEEQEEEASKAMDPLAGIED